MNIFTALDYSEKKPAIELVKKTIAINPFFKVGLELFVAEGPRVVEEIIGLGGRVFLDLKFHDIPNTAAGAVRSAARMGAEWMNIHCGGGAEMMKASLDAINNETTKLGKARPVLLGVTVLTSLDDKAVEEIGFPRSASAQVKHFVELALAAGLDGVVCSGQELALVQSLAGKKFQTMVPGIRPTGASVGDQKRTLTPKEAKLAGAHHIVVGRPITAAADPVAALTAILGEI